MLAVLLFSGTCVKADDWPQWRGPNRDATWKETGILHHELSRVHLLDGTYPFNGRTVVWPPPAYANGHVFARNDKELICASLAAAQPK